MFVRLSGIHSLTNRTLSYRVTALCLCSDQFTTWQVSRLPYLVSSTYGERTMKIAKIEEKVKMVNWGRNKLTLLTPYSIICQIQGYNL